MQNLTDCEQIVMKVIWDVQDDISLVQVMDRLENHYHKNWKRQTVSTFLVHLIQKGFLTSYRVGRVFYYHKEIELETYRTAITREFVDFWYHSSRAAINDVLDQLQYNE